MGKAYGVGDVHGDHDRMMLVLRKAGFVDEAAGWSGGDATLVFTGDLTDRGHEGYAVVSTLMRLQREAAAAGGEVESLMGNHDPLILAKARELRGEDVHQYCTPLFTSNGGRYPDAAALAKDGEAMAWLAARPAMLLRGGTLFQHADGFDYYARLGALEGGVDAVNARMREICGTGSGAFSVFYDMTDERAWNKRPQDLAAYVASLGAQRVAHGHTRFVGNRPRVYQDGLAINLDGSMSSGYRRDQDRGFGWEAPADAA